MTFGAKQLTSSTHLQLGNATNIFLLKDTKIIATEHTHIRMHTHTFTFSVINSSSLQTSSI